MDEPHVASWRMTFFVLASAVSIGLLAAMAVIPVPENMPGAPPPPPRPGPTVAASPPRSAQDQPRVAPPPDAVSGSDAAAGRQESGDAPPLLATVDPVPAEPAREAFPAESPAPAVEEPFLIAPIPAPPAATAADTSSERTAGDAEPEPPAPDPTRPTFRETALAIGIVAPRPAPVAGTAGEKRCRAILVRTTLGEDLSYADKEHLRGRCQLPGR